MIALTKVALSVGLFGVAWWIIYTPEGGSAVMAIARVGGIV